MKALSTLLALVVLGAATVQAQEPQAAGAAVTAEAVLARSVVDRVPQDTGTAFPADVGELTLWTRVTGAAVESVIHHVWMHGDEQVADIELRIGGSPWRTWSRKTIPPDWTGAWHVEVRDAAGTVLQRIDFTIGQ
jgi:hypothetical protein